jgi:chaperonin GroEL (HSP60 family)
VNKLADLIGVTLGPLVQRAGMLFWKSKYCSPKVVNDGVTVAKEVYHVFVVIVPRLSIELQKALFSCFWDI